MTGGSDASSLQAEDLLNWLANWTNPFHLPKSFFQPNVEYAFQIEPVEYSPQFKQPRNSRWPEPPKIKISAAIKDVEDIAAAAVAATATATQRIGTPPSSCSRLLTL